jgi:anti-sigma B factor antagonist
MDSYVAAPFEAALWFDAGRTVLELEGELDVYSAQKLRGALLNVYEKAGDLPLLLVVDLAKLRFMDSSGLGTLIAGLKRTRATGGAMTLVAPQASIMRTLRITGLVRVLPVHETLAAALEGLAGTAAAAQP